MIRCKKPGIWPQPWFVCPISAYCKIYKLFIPEVKNEPERKAGNGKAYRGNSAPQ